MFLYQVSDFTYGIQLEQYYKNITKILHLYITYCYIHNHSKKDKQRARAYLLLLITAFINLGLDIATVYTVNHLETVNSTLNMILHLLFIISIPTMMVFLFEYITLLCGLKMKKVILYSPYIAGIFIATVTISKLEYRIGSFTNYSINGMEKDTQQEKKNKKSH